MKRIETEFAGGKSKTIRFVKDGVLEDLQNSLNEGKSLKVVEIYPMNNEQNASRYHSNLNTVVFARELPN